MGRDISQAARNTVVMKAQGYINQESGKFIHKGLKALMRDLAEIGLRIGESSVKRLLTQFRKQTFQLEEKATVGENQSRRRK